MRLLVTGGAGYIGSVVGALLVAEGHDVIVLDDLSTGHEDAVPTGASLVRGTLRDDAPRLLADGVDAVLHFAAKSLVGESVAQPSLYWGNNLGGSLALLEAMRAAGTPRIVFSSTAAVYGEPETVPIDETAPTRPTSPYGASKVAVDTALAEYARMHGLGAISLRYFNVAGAHPEAVRPGDGAPAADGGPRRRSALARGAALARDPPHPQRARRGPVGGPRLGRPADPVRRRLPHQGRHLRPGLHPRGGPGPGPPAGPGRRASPASTGSTTWAASPGSPTSRSWPNAGP